MTASLSRLPAREDAPHAPPLLARPLTLRTWPTATASVNDNHATEIDWDSLCEPAAVAVVVPPPSKRRATLRDAAYGLAGAVAIVIAILCLIAR